MEFEVFNKNEIEEMYNAMAADIQMEDVTKMVLELANAYQTNKEIQEVQDSIYGEGATAYIGTAMEAFYKK